MTRSTPGRHAQSLLITLAVVGLSLFLGVIGITIWLGPERRTNVPEPPAGSAQDVDWPFPRAGSYLALTPETVQDARKFTFEGLATFDEQGFVEFPGTPNDLAYVTASSAINTMIAKRVPEQGKLTLMAVIVPGEVSTSGPASIINCAALSGHPLFRLFQDGNQLKFALRVSSDDEEATTPELELLELADTQPVNVAVTYEPGRLLYFANGQLLGQHKVAGELKWPEELVFELGESPLSYAEQPWPGKVGYVALYGHALPATIVAKNHERLAPHLPQ